VDFCRQARQQQEEEEEPTMDAQNQTLAAGHPSALLRLDPNYITVPVNGFLMPLIALITLVNNALVLAILLRRQMSERVSE